MVAFWDKLKFVKKPFGGAKPGITVKKTESAAPVISPTATETADAYRVLIRPVVSEKAAHLADDGQYSFEVAVNASSGAIAEAFQKVYGIAPTRVNIIRKHGKKAIITLPEGKRIKLFEGV